MNDEFDMAAAVESVSSGLGFDADSNSDIKETSDDLELTAGSELEKGTAESESAEKPGKNLDTRTAGTVPTPVGAVPPGAPTDAPKPDELPKTWSPALATKWAGIDPEIKTQILKREEDIFRGIETYKQAADIGNRTQTAIAPFLSTMQQFGIDPYQHIQTLMNSHHTLALGTQAQKQDMLQRLARDYAIELPGPAGEAADPSFVDPEVGRLRDTVSRLESRLGGYEQARTADTTATIAKQVDQFAADPKNIHYVEVANGMAHLLSTGVAKDLAEAYDKAVWLNPQTREKESQRLATERQAKSESDLTAKKAAETVRAQNAKRTAGLNLRASVKHGSGTAPKGTIDETLQEKFAEILARES